MPPIALALLALLPGVDYLTEVKPLMATRCVACHGALQQKGGLRLDTVARMRIGGDSGPAIVAGKPSESRQRVTAHRPDADMKAAFLSRSSEEGLKPDQAASIIYRAEINERWLEQAIAA